MRKKKVRRWIVILATVVVLALLAGIGRFWLGWGRPSYTKLRQTAGGYASQSEPATLEEALAAAHRALGEIEHDIRDYSAIIIKKERSGDKSTETVMFAKVREKPFSVYLYFFARRDDPSVKGREVIYVQGRNDGRLLVHTPGFIAGRLGTVSLNPTGFLAMNGERHPITEIGLANLCRQLIQRGESLGDPSQVQVKRYRHARIDTRACTLLEITYPVHEPRICGYLVRIFLDDQWHFPIRVEVYQLPLDHGQGPQLEEEYTYLHLKLNNGYGDADFDTKNRQYKFP